MSRRRAAARRTSLHAVTQYLGNVGGIVVAYASKIRPLTYIVTALGAVTPLGWGALIVGSLGVILGATMAWKELFIPGVAVLTIVVTAFISSLRRLRCHVEIDVPLKRVAVGEDIAGTVIVDSDPDKALRSIQLRLAAGPHILTLWTPRLKAGQRHSEPFIISTSKRGVLNVGPVEAVHADALGMARRVKSRSSEVEVFVHPKTIRMTGAAVGYLRDIEGISTQDLSSSDVSFRALRDYAPGDDRRMIHWRTSARIGRLMIRQFEETRRAHLLIVFDLDVMSWRDDDEFEDAVSAVASLARGALDESVMVAVVTQEGMLNTATALRALDSLTEVMLLEAYEDLAQTAHFAAAQVSQASVSVVVTGSGVSVTKLHEALRVLPHSTRNIGIRLSRGSTTKTHTFGELRIVEIPHIDELPLAMNRVL